MVKPGETSVQRITEVVVNYLRRGKPRLGSIKVARYQEEGTHNQPIRKKLGWLLHSI